jgi:hypothetical protein
MTSIELLKQDLDAELKLGTKMVVNWDMYIEMHKQEIIDAIEDGRYEFGYEYYNDTFVSKGSDALKDYHIVDTNEMVDQVPDVRKMVDDEIKELKITLDKVAHYRMGYNRAKETLYTEEQVREAIDMARKDNSPLFVWDFTIDEIIQSLKQPKKD